MVYGGRQDRKLDHAFRSMRQGFYSRLRTNYAKDNGLSRKTNHYVCVENEFCQMARKNGFRFSSHEHQITLICTQSMTTPQFSITTSPQKTSKQVSISKS